MYLHARRIASVPIRRRDTADLHRNEPTGNRQFYGTVFAVFVQFAIAAATGRHFVTHPDPKARQNRMQNRQQGVSFSLTPRSGVQTRFLSPESQETGISFRKSHGKGNPFPPSHETSRTQKLPVRFFFQKLRETRPFSTPPPVSVDFPPTGRRVTRPDAMQRPRPEQIRENGLPRCKGHAKGRFSNPAVTTQEGDAPYCASMNWSLPIMPSLVMPKRCASARTWATVL